MFENIVNFFKGLGKSKENEVTEETKEVIEKAEEIVEEIKEEVSKENSEN